MSAEFQYVVSLSHNSADKPRVRVVTLSASTGERGGVRCRSFGLVERLRAANLRQIKFGLRICAAGGSGEARAQHRWEGQLALSRSGQRRTTLHPVSKHLLSQEALNHG